MLSHDTSNPVRSAPPPLSGARHALFLDLDGTLVEIAERPELVSAPPHLRALLKDTYASLGGALALLTGRTLASADMVLGEALPHVAGVHGFEHRVAGETVRMHVDTNPVGAALTDVRALVDSGALAVRVENKQAAIALHYRSTPHAEDAVVRLTTMLAKRHGLSVLRGKMVVELRPSGRTKGDALASFMETPPFAGRIPVAIGDDTTDEDAFAAAQRRGGFAILIGPERNTHALYRLDDTPSLLSWLRSGLKP